MFTLASILTVISLTCADFHSRNDTLIIMYLVSKSFQSSSLKFSYKISKYSYKISKSLSAAFSNFSNDCFLECAPVVRNFSTCSVNAIARGYFTKLSFPLFVINHTARHARPCLQRATLLESIFTHGECRDSLRRRKRNACFPRDGARQAGKHGFFENSSADRERGGDFPQRMEITVRRSNKRKKCFSPLARRRSERRFQKHRQEIFLVRFVFKISLVQLRSRI